MADDPTPPGSAIPQIELGTVSLIERGITLLLVMVLLLGVLVILKPFAAGILFGAILAIAAWPMRQWLIRHGLGRRIASALLLLSCLVVVVLPALLMAPMLTDDLKDFVESIRSYFAATPVRPDWLERVPLVGGKLAATWDGLIRTKGDLSVALAPHSAMLQLKLLTAARALGDSLVQILLALIVSTMFWVNGSKLIRELDRIVGRLGGATARASLRVAGDAVRSISYGVIGTALAQASLLALGLALAGVPGATTLGFIGLLLSISQIGAPLLILIWGGAAWWLFQQGLVGWGGFMIAWGVLVSLVDNVLKPWLIGRGIQMPMPLTVLGVFGGFIAFGFLGLFIGPTLLAVAFVLLGAWRHSGEDEMRGHARPTETSVQPPA